VGSAGSGSWRRRAVLGAERWGGGRGLLGRCGRWCSGGELDCFWDERRGRVGWVLYECLSGKGVGFDR